MLREKSQCCGRGWRSLETGVLMEDGLREATVDRQTSRNRNEVGLNQEEGEGGESHPRERSRRLEELPTCFLP